MKNLWRIVILFLLPGTVFGGGSVIAFFRLGDAPFEPLMTAAAAPVIWTGVLWLAMIIADFFRNPGRFYYYTVFFMALGFSGGVGICRLCGGCGWLEGLIGCVVSAAAAGWLLHAFASRSFTWLDRWCFMAGCLLSGAVICYLESIYRLNWLETLFFFAEEMLLLSWMLASPLTLRGKFISRTCRRSVFLAAGAAVFFVSPVLSYPPWSGSPAAMPNGEWQWSFVTAHGSQFGWIDPDDNCGTFSGSGDLMAWKTADEEILIGIPGILSLMQNDRPAIKLAAYHGSVLPNALQEMQIEWIKLPESMNRPVDFAGCGLWGQKYDYDNETELEKYDLLLISALNDNPYPGAVRNFWRHVSSGLKRDAVVVISGGLLQNPELFKILHESFAFNGVLPGAESLWVFSNRKPELSKEQVAENLREIYGEDTDFPLEAYLVMLSDNSLWESFADPPMPKKLLLGKNQWSGGCMWWIIGLLVMVCWRVIRIFCERRSIMYDYWNSIENGFVGMGVFLLVIGLLIMNLAIPALTIALLTLMWALVLIGKSPFGVMLSLIMLLLLPIVAMSAEGSALWLILAAALHQVLHTGALAQNEGMTVRVQRSLRNGVAGGMFIAAVMMALVWMFNIPLLPVAVIFFIARLPGIWQCRDQGVYYSR